MLPLLFLLAALSATTPPAEGSYFLIDEDEEAMGVIDADSVVREGGRARGVMTAAFAEPGEGGVWVIRMVEEADCASNRLRHLDYAGFSRDLRLIEQVSEPTEWRAPPPDTRAERIVAFLCRGSQLEAAGDDYLPIARAYWSRRRGEQAA